MKKKNSVAVFLLVLLMCSTSYAVDLTCGDPVFTVLVESFITANSSGLDCQTAIGEANYRQRTLYEAKGWFNGCAVDTCAFVDNCSVIRVEVWCTTTATLNQVSNVQQSVVGNESISGVEPGQEMAAAEAFANNYFASHTYPVVPGKVRTDGAAGFSYTTTMGANDSVALVDVVAWKRGIYTNAGDNPIPLGDLGGTGTGSGGSGGGATAAEIQSAMEAALSGVGNIAAVTQAVTDALNGNDLYADQIRQAFENAIYNTGLNLSGGGGSGGGITSAELAVILDSILAGGGPGGLSVPGIVKDVNDGRHSVRASEFKNEIQGVFTGFVDNMKTTGIYTAISGFFGGIPAAGAAPVVEIAGGRLGNHSFDFQKWASMLAVLSTVLKVVFTFIGVRIVAVNGV